jgi:hypothetical protein
MLGEGDLGLHLAGIGIKDVAEAPRCALYFFAADEMADLTHELSPWTTAGAVGLKFLQHNGERA